MVRYRRIVQLLLTSGGAGAGWTGFTFDQRLHEKEGGLALTPSSLWCQDVNKQRTICKRTGCQLDLAPLSDLIDLFS